MPQHGRGYGSRFIREGRRAKQKCRAKRGIGRFSFPSLGHRQRGKRMDFIPPKSQKGDILTRKQASVFAWLYKLPHVGSLVVSALTFMSAASKLVQSFNVQLHPNSIHLSDFRSLVVQVASWMSQIRRLLL